MIARAQSRGVYDVLAVANINTGLPTNEFPSSSFELIICTGAMELLDRARVLQEFSRVLTKGAFLWISYQADLNNTVNPTSHQGICGVSRECMVSELRTAGFVVDGDCCGIELCERAFYTPVSENHNVTLIPVPYFFVCARRE
jgi:hypothetical protein